MKDIFEGRLRPNSKGYVRLEGEELEKFFQQRRDNFKKYPIYLDFYTRYGLHSDNGYCSHEEFFNSIEEAKEYAEKYLQELFENYNEDWYLVKFTIYSTKDPNLWEITHDIVLTPTNELIVKWKDNRKDNIGISPAIGYLYQEGK